MLWFRLFGAMLLVRSKISRKPNLLNDDPAEVSYETLVELAATFLALEAKSRRRRQMVLHLVGRGRGRRKGKKGGGGRVPPPAK